MEFHTAHLKCTRLYDDVQLPTTATEMSIGADVYAYCKSERGHPIKFAIGAGMTRMIPTGLVVVSEPPYAAFVCSRSGLATKAIFVTNAPGIIDPDYRGEVKILLHNATSTMHWVEHGDRIAQIVLVPVPIPLISEAMTDLRHLASLRGEAGFGSTGR